MISTTRFLTSLICLTYLATAFPILPKREIVTRVHTASTTNVVTDFYSTTTEVVIAPTVEFLISDSVTFTTTLIPQGVNPTAEPTTTITKVLVKKVEMTTSSLQPTSTLQPTPTSSYQPTSALQPVSTQQTDITSPTTSSGENAQQTATTSASASTPTSTSTSTPTPTPTSTSTSTSTSSQNVVSGVGEANVVESSQTQHHSHQAAETMTENQQTSTSTTSQKTTEATTSTTFSTSSSTEDAATTTSLESSSGSAAITSSPKAIAYSPYNDDGSCKSADSVSSDLSLIKSKGITKIRVYGTDCNSFETVQPAAVSLGIKINQGLYITSSGVDSIDDSVSTLIEYGQTNGWDVFDFITVGNEAIHNGWCSVSDLVSKISSVKSQLNNAGYSGQITTSEPPVSFENNPDLCTSSEIDFVGINPHAYFDTNASAESAGTFVKSQVELIQSVCGTSNVFVTETGYPSAGIQNGGNIPSTANQITAVQNILDEMDLDITILSTYNDYWKSPGDYGIEQSFGVIEYFP